MNEWKPIKLSDDVEEIRKLEFFAEEKWSSDKNWTVIDAGTEMHKLAEKVIESKLCFISTPRHKTNLWSKYLDLPDLKKSEVMTVDILGSGFIGEIDHIAIHQIEVDPYTEYGVKPKTKTPHHVKPWKNKRYF